MSDTIETGPAIALAPDVVVLRDIMIPMRDGVMLATDVYLPTKGEARPAILERTPYDKTGTSRSERSVAAPDPLSREALAMRMVREGYVMVWQDCRGRHKSGGSFTKYVNEAEDGFDTIAWIAAQDWCDGQVGMMGLSYDAHTQMAAACLAPPALACMVLDSGGFSNAFTCGIRQGGAFELKQATWAYNHALESPEARDPLVAGAIRAENLHDWFAHMPWTRDRSPIRWAPDYEAYLLDQWQHGTFDAFWQRTGIWAAGYYDAIPKVPVALMSSWYDTYVPTTLENYRALRAERPVALILGPWTHGNRSSRVFGDVDFGPAATFDGQVDDTWLDWRLKWFDAALRGGADRQSGKVWYFVMGGGSGRRTAEGHLDHGGAWASATTWPPENARKLTLHPRPDMTLGDAPGQGAHIEWSFDPADPVPTLGGALTSGEPIFTGGPVDQVEAEGFFGCTTPGLPLKARRDVVSFETEPLEHDMVIAGPVTVHLRVTTDAPDTDFTAKLVDVHPPSPDYPRGYGMILCDGIFRLRYRDGYDAPRLVEPGEGPFDITVTPFDTANRFCKGHRIRLDISSSNFPKFDVNPNTGAPEGTGRAMRIALNGIMLGEGTRLELMALPTT
ncbi:CocE/NonD family hydrolase [Oceaniglobus trochenteri]|uniref:CocE/NonD family hydrolase n=1 Tax=Oceaniglobus trochenteri TaxID=2763260 RepID=UPI001CFFAFBA